jgi:hypothetical protein
MSHFKFVLDQSVKHLADHFTSGHVMTLKDIGLPENASDADIVERVGDCNFTLVAANRKDFLPLVRAYIAASRKKEGGCQRFQGLVLLIPNEEHVQRRALERAKRDLVLDGGEITWKDVHDRELLVEIEASGRARVSRLPRCPHCNHYDGNDK